MASGADVRRIYFVQGVADENGEILPFDPARDIPTLNAAVSAIGGASLLLVDPIVSAVAGDMHKANDVRRGLQALVDFAEAYDCAVLGITHFAKGSAGSSPQERVIGSQAFGALARMVLVAAKQEDSETRVLARAKSNISLDDGGVSYTISPHALDSGIETTRVLWGDRIDGSARDILEQVETQPTVETTEQEDAEEFLRGLLADGPVPSKQVKADADGAGFAWATIRRAQKAIGAEAYRAGEGIGSKASWFWRLAAKPGIAKVLIETPKVLTEKREHLRGALSILGDTTSAMEETF